jgi:hypothetical protein
MNKFFFGFIFITLAGTAIFAQQPVIASAPPMVMTNPLTPDEAGSVGRVYDNTLSEAGNVRIINQLVLEKGMRDYEFQQRDWANIEKTIAFGEALGIEWVIRPQLQKRVRGNVSEIIMTAVLLNINTKKIIYSTPALIRNPNETSSKIDALVNEITQIINGVAGGLASSDQSIYIVGDRGPAGGWIIHDNGDYFNGWRYLEIAPKATEISIAQTRSVERISGLSRDVGSGKRNTELILQANLNQNDFTITQAARYCANMDINWFKDWFLPSYSELSRITMLRANFAEFSTAYYWTSSGSGSANTARASPDTKLPDRNQPYLVRAVRAF